MTVPSLMQTTKNKEFHSMFKKNYSVFQNALRRAQLEEGLLGDNTAVFEPCSGGNECHYASAKKLAKYLNVIKLCKHVYEPGCDSLYYPIKYTSGYTGDDYYGAYLSTILLNDGSIWIVTQSDTCEELVEVCKTDSSGNCLKDAQGNNIMEDWNKQYCALLVVDVNGAKGPNKFGRDSFMLHIYRNKIVNDRMSSRAGLVQKDIILNRI